MNLALRPKHGRRRSRRHQLQQQQKLVLSQERQQPTQLQELLPQALRSSSSAKSKSQSQSQHARDNDDDNCGRQQQQQQQIKEKQQHEKQQQQHQHQQRSWTKRLLWNPGRTTSAHVVVEKENNDSCDNNNDDDHDHVDGICAAAGTGTGTAAAAEVGIETVQNQDGTIMTVKSIEEYDGDKDDDVIAADDDNDTDLLSLGDLSLDAVACDNSTMFDNDKRKRRSSSSSAANQQEQLQKQMLSSVLAASSGLSSILWELFIEDPSPTTPEISPTTMDDNRNDEEDRYGDDNRTYIGEYDGLGDLLTPNCGLGTDTVSAFGTTSEGRLRRTTKIKRKKIRWKQSGCTPYAVLESFSVSDNDESSYDTDDNEDEYNEYGGCDDDDDRDSYTTFSDYDSSTADGRSGDTGLTSTVESQMKKRNRARRSKKKNEDRMIAAAAALNKQLEQKKINDASLVVTKQLGPKSSMTSLGKPIPRQTSSARSAWKTNKSKRILLDSSPIQYNTRDNGSHCNRNHSSSRKERSVVPVTEFAKKKSDSDTVGAATHVDPIEQFRQMTPKEYRAQAFVQEVLSHQRSDSHGKQNLNTNLNDGATEAPPVAARKVHEADPSAHQLKVHNKTVTNPLRHPQKTFQAERIHPIIDDANLKPVSQLVETWRSMSKEDDEEESVFMLLPAKSSAQDESGAMDTTTLAQQSHSHHGQYIANHYHSTISDDEEEDQATSSSMSTYSSTVFKGRSRRSGNTKHKPTYQRQESRLNDEEDYRRCRRYVPDIIGQEERESAFSLRHTKLHDTSADDWAI